MWERTVFTRIFHSTHILLFIKQAPTSYSGKFFRRKIASLFADLHLLRDRVGGADFSLRYYFVIRHNFCMLFFIKSAPSRLTPNEALPQTPQGTLSLDPASPLTPGLSLRFISRYARCWGTALVSYAHSSFLIPHLSFLTPHFNREVYPRSYPASHPQLLLSHRYRKLSQTSGL